MPTIPGNLPETLTLRAPQAGPGPGRLAGALDQAAALWEAKARTARTLAAPPTPADFPDPQALADALDDWRDGLLAAAEEALEGRPRALEAWRAWFDEEQARLAAHLEEAGLHAAVQRAGAALREELAAARARALDPARPGDAETASRDALAALEQAVALGVLDEQEAERTAAGLAQQVQAGLAAQQADADPAGLLAALKAGDYPALDQAARQGLGDRAALRLALAEAQAAAKAARSREDVARGPAVRGRILLRAAEAGLREALGDGDPAAAQDAARDLAALPGFATQARDLVKSLEKLPAAQVFLAQTAWAPPAARAEALEQAARSWPGPLAAACREALDEAAEALARDPAGYVRPEAERRLRAASLDPQAEPEALRLLVLDLQAGAGAPRPAVLGLAERAALREAWLARDPAGRVEFLAALSAFAGFRRRVAAEVLGPRGPVLQLAAESPALGPAEKAAVLAAAYAPDPGPAGGEAASSGPDRAASPDPAAAPHPALAALAGSEPQAAAALADLARRLAGQTGDPERAAWLLDALAPEALRLWGQAPALTAPGEDASPYRQDEAGPYPPTGDENSGPPEPKDEEDTLKGGAGEETLAGGEGKAAQAGEQEGKDGQTGKSLDLLNPTGGPLRYQDPHGKGEFGAPRKNTVDGKEYTHTGVDWAGDVGGEVKAPMDGTLRVTEKGDVVVYTKPDNDGQSHAAVLAHVDALDSSGTDGKKVKRGDLVGKVKDPSKYVTTGDPKTMIPHVHLKLQQNIKGQAPKVLNPDEHMEKPDLDRLYPPQLRGYHDR